MIAIPLDGGKGQAKGLTAKGLTPEMEIVYLVSKYTGYRVPEVLTMPYREFLNWVSLMEKYPDVSIIIDTHLARLQTLITGGLISEALLIAPDRDKLIAAEKQQRLIQNLSKFGKE